MANPQINFRINRKHIAQGIHYLLNLEPNQPVPPSASILVRTLYIDALTKADFHNPIYITPAQYAAADALIANSPQAETAWEKASFQVKEERNALKDTQTNTATQPSQPVSVVPAPQQAQPPDMTEMFNQFQQFMQHIQQVKQPEQPKQSEQPTQLTKAEIIAREDLQAEQIIVDAKIQAKAKAEAERKKQNDLDNEEQINRLCLSQERPKASEFDTSDEYETESEINTVTDFSPPSEWKSE